MRNHKTIEQLDMSERATGILKSNGITTAEQVKGLSIDDIIRFKYNCEDALTEISYKISKLNKEGNNG